METVLISLSCFGHMCNELEIIQNSDSPNEIPTAQDMHVYRSLSDEACKFRSGKVICPICKTHTSCFEITILTLFIINYKDLLSEGLIVDWELVKLNFTVITFYLHLFLFWHCLPGRAALQRRIMALLRQLDRQTQGNLQVCGTIMPR